MRRSRSGAGGRKVEPATRAHERERDGVGDADAGRCHRTAELRRRRRLVQHVDLGDGDRGRSEIDRRGRVGSEPTRYRAAPLKLPLVVKVSDQFGNPVPDVTVTGRGAGSGALTARRRRRTRAGRPAIGTRSATSRASIRSPRPSPGVDAPAVFSAQAVAGAPGAIAAVGRATASRRASTRCSRRSSIRVADNNGNPLIGAVVTWTATNGTLERDDDHRCHGHDVEHDDGRARRGSSDRDRDRRRAVRSSSRRRCRRVWSRSPRSERAAGVRGGGADDRAADSGGAAGRRRQLDAGDQRGHDRARSKPGWRQARRHADAKRGRRCRDVRRSADRQGRRRLHAGRVERECREHHEREVQRHAWFDLGRRRSRSTASSPMCPSRSREPSSRSAERPLRSLAR